MVDHRRPDPSHTDPHPAGVHPADLHGAGLHRAGPHDTGQPSGPRATDVDAAGDGGRVSRGTDLEGRGAQVAEVAEVAEVADTLPWHRAAVPNGRPAWWVPVVVMLAAAVMLAVWVGAQAHGQGWWPATGLPPSQQLAVTPAALDRLTANPWASGPGDGTATFDSRRDGFAATADQEQAENAPKPRYRTVPDGVEVAEFSLPGGGKRSEIVPDVPADRDGEERWVRYRAQLRDMPVDTESWQLILQWHHNGNSGSPPIALEVGQGELRLANEGSHQQSLGPIGPDDVVDVVLHVRFSQDPGEGLVEVWRDGRPVLAGYHPPGGTLLDSSNYLKFGLYRDPDITAPSSMTVTDLVIGDTPTAVGATR